MAVVFISPKKTQRTFLLATGMGVMLLAVIIFFWIFLASGPSDQQINVSFNKTKIVLNFKVLDSDQFKSLENFEPMLLQFRYTAQTPKGQVVKGFISATSEVEARKSLEASGLIPGQVILVIPGRDNPFIPYAQPTKTIIKTK